MAVGIPMKWFALLFALVSFHRLDGHIVWVNPVQVNDVQGAAQLGMNEGTMVSVGPDHVVVKENVNEVIQTLREAK
jgi:uncharacterized protein YlzI (FlbEa/FlbD family)